MCSALGNAPGRVFRRLAQVEQQRILAIDELRRRSVPTSRDEDRRRCDQRPHQHRAGATSASTSGQLFDEGKERSTRWSSWMWARESEMIAHGCALNPVRQVRNAAAALHYRKASSPQGPDARDRLSCRRLAQSNGTDSRRGGPRHTAAQIPEFVSNSLHAAGHRTSGHNGRAGRRRSYAKSSVYSLLGHFH